MVDSAAGPTTYNAADDQKLKASHLFTSESVTEGHPDKIADQISDTILDAALADDPMSRVACETLVTTGLVVVAGEITTSTYVDISTLVREKVSKIGYTRAKFGFDAETCGVIVSIDPQSADIAQGVDREEDEDLDEIGAGDQGMMFGYACEETEELMPLPITLAHALTRRLSDVRKSRVLDYLRPDGKSQVTVRYEGDRPVGIEKILISAQHRDGVETHIKDDLFETVIRPVMPEELLRPGRDRDHGQPHGQVRYGRTSGRHGTHGAQDHRGYLRGFGPARRGRFLGQGPDQGRPLGLLRRKVGGEKPRRGGTRRPVPGPGGIRDRRRPSRERDGRDLRHSKDRPGDPRRAGAGTFRPQARRHYPRPEVAEPQLCADRRIRPLRTQEPGFTWEDTSVSDDLRRAAGF